MNSANLKPHLNSLLEKIYSNGGQVDEVALGRDCGLLWANTPFAHITNYSDALKTLEQYFAWISYGGNRTGSTFATITLKTLLESMIGTFLTAWEGDFKNPEKFFDLVVSTPGIAAGILKIHRNEEFCNRLLRSNRAKAIVTIRDYQSIAGSYARMKKNQYSPFYTENEISEKDLISFIHGQIREEKKKKELPNTLFIREDEIRSQTQRAISRIAKHFGIHLSETSALLISKKLNIKSQKNAQKNIILNSTGHDRQNFMHYAHINPGNQEYGKEYSDLIFSNFGELLDKDGYLKNKGSI